MRRASGRRANRGQRNLPGRTAFRCATLLAVFFLAASAFAREEARPAKKHFLWTVRSDTATVYLLGSIHLLKKEMFPLHREIEDAYERCGVLVVEADVRSSGDGSRGQALLQGAMYPDGDTLENHLSKETYGLLRRKFPGLATGPASRFKPWAVAMTIAVMEYQKVGLDYNYGIDVYFLDKASKRKKVREIERYDTVITMLNGFSDEYQDLFLFYTLKDLDRIGEKSGEIIDAWAAGDERAMESILTESVREYPRLKPVFDALITRRNAEMAARIEEYLKERQDFFVVVGAGHMVGEKGIVERLRKKGYAVEQR